MYRVRLAFIPFKLHDIWSVASQENHLSDCVCLSLCYLFYCVTMGLYPIQINGMEWNGITRNSSGDETANVNFLYDDIVHVYYKIQ